MRRQRDFPKEVSLRHDARPWRVRFVRFIPPEEGDPPDNPSLGNTDPSTKTIDILQGQTPWERLKTFVHELMHAVEYDYGIEIDHKLIYALEMPLAYLLWSNCTIEWEGIGQALLDREHDECA